MSALKQFCNNCLYFSLLPLVAAYFIDTALMLTTLIVCIALTGFTILLAFLTIRIKKQLNQLGAFDNLKLLMFKFLGSGFIFLVFFILDYNTKPFAILFMTSYFIQTTLFALFLGKLNNGGLADNQ